MIHDKGFGSEGDNQRWMNHVRHLEAVGFASNGW